MNLKPGIGTPLLLISPKRAGALSPVFPFQEFLPADVRIVVRNEAERFEVLPFEHVPNLFRFKIQDFLDNDIFVCYVVLYQKIMPQYRHFTDQKNDSHYEFMIIHKAIRIVKPYIWQKGGMMSGFASPASDMANSLGEDACMVYAKAIKVVGKGAAQGSAKLASACVVIVSGLAADGIAKAFRAIHGWMKVRRELRQEIEGLREERGGLESVRDRLALMKKQRKEMEAGATKTGPAEKDTATIQAGAAHDRRGAAANPGLGDGGRPKGEIGRLMDEIAGLKQEIGDLKREVQGLSEEAGLKVGDLLENARHGGGFSKSDRPADEAQSGPGADPAAYGSLVKEQNALEASCAENLDGAPHLPPSPHETLFESER